MVIIIFWCDVLNVMQGPKRSGRDTSLNDLFVWGILGLNVDLPFSLHSLDASYVCLKVMQQGERQGTFDDKWHKIKNILYGYGTLLETSDKKRRRSGYWKLMRKEACCPRASKGPSWMGCRLPCLAARIQEGARHGQETELWPGTQEGASKYVVW